MIAIIKSRSDPLDISIMKDVQHFECVWYSNRGDVMKLCTATKTDDIELNGYSVEITTENDKSGK